MKGDAGFHKLLEEIGELHDKKQADYGRDGDPFANVRGSSEWGIEPWVGALLRAGDKMKRLQKAARGGNLVNESIEDSMMDAAVYCLISLRLFREAKPDPYDLRDPYAEKPPALTYTETLRKDYG